MLKIKIQPRAARNEFAETLGDAIKIRITAAPVDDKANKQLITFLARSFAVTQSQIDIISGRKNRNKQILIRSPQTLPDFIQPLDK